MFKRVIIPILIVFMSLQVHAETKYSVVNPELKARLKELQNEKIKAVPKLDASFTPYDDLYYIPDSARALYGTSDFEGKAAMLLSVFNVANAKNVSGNAEKQLLFIHFMAGLEVLASSKIASDYQVSLLTALSQRINGRPASTHLWISLSTERRNEIENAQVLVAVERAEQSEPHYITPIELAGSELSTQRFRIRSSSLAEIMENWSAKEEKITSKLPWKSGKYTTYEELLNKVNSDEVKKVIR